MRKKCYHTGHRVLFAIVAAVTFASCGEKGSNVGTGDLTDGRPGETSDERSALDQRDPQDLDAADIPEPADVDAPDSIAPQDSTVPADADAAEALAPDADLLDSPSPEDADADTGSDADGALDFEGTDMPDAGQDQQGDGWTDASNPADAVETADDADADGEQDSPEVTDLADDSEVQTVAFCGDGVCQPEVGETAQACLFDCGSCGDGVCGAGEKDAGCDADCAPFCGNGTCDTAESGDPGDVGFCPVDCGSCGDGICGFIDFVLGCQSQDCPPTCGDGACGEGETPFSCPKDCGAPCGNGLCELGETSGGCPVDCGTCGDGICGKVGADFELCPKDCVAPCGDGKCSWGESGIVCPLDCGGCGDFICSFAELAAGSCAGDCGGCGDTVCSPGETETSCAADCAVCLPLCEPGWECGDAGCGQACGMCGDGEVCFEHFCCVPDCTNKECGSDGCGGSCGGCEAWEECGEGQCLCSDDGGLEDNNDCVKASKIEPGSFSGLAICPASDEDWFTIFVDEGKTLTLELSYEHDLGDLDLFLFKPWNCGGPIVSSMLNGDFETITFTAPQGDYYLIRVSGVGGFAGNLYDLTASIGLPVCGDGECNGGETCESCGKDCGVCCLDCDYWEVCVDGQCACRDDVGMEPNEACTSAVALVPDTLEDLSICDGGDQDWYTVKVQGGETLAVTAKFSHNIGNLDLYLYPHGNCVGWVAKSTGLSDGETIVYPSPFTSWYYILIKGAGPAIGNVYDLDIVAYPPTCGNGMCDPGEACGSCPKDCKCGCGETCIKNQCLFTACVGLACGDDGCGGQCGQCPAGSKCEGHTCICDPSCAGKECGGDGCGGSCGSCNLQHECLDGLCVCVPVTCDSIDYQCGQFDDGCGGKIGCYAECPDKEPVDIFLVIGQSNARGRGTGQAAVSVEPGTAFDYDPVANGLFNLQYPTGLPVGNYWTSDQTSFVVAFAKTWYTLSGRRPVFVCRAKGGTALVEAADMGQGDWTDVTDSDGVYGTAVAAYLAALDHVESHPDFMIGHKYVIWHQGETDADQGISWTEYRTTLKALFEKLDAEVGFDAFFVSEIGYRLPYNFVLTSQYLEVIKGLQYVQQTLAKAVLVSKLPRQLTMPCLGNQEDPACALWDNYHYETWAYEQLGTDMSTNAWAFVSTGKKPLTPDL